MTDSNRRRAQARYMRHFDGVERVVYPTQQLRKINSGVILVSRTDERGVITHVNRAFCEVSRYFREELVGAPHYIIRHPDMPKEIFRKMWETLESGEEWHGYVKNLCKDGDHYWVYATVVPIISERRIVGYTSVRRTIDSATIHRCERANWSED